MDVFHCPSGILGGLSTLAKKEALISAYHVFCHLHRRNFAKDLFHTNISLPSDRLTRAMTFVGYNCSSIVRGVLVHLSCTRVIFSALHLG